MRDIKPVNSAGVKYEAMLKRLEEKILDTRKIHTTN